MGRLVGAVSVVQVVGDRVGHGLPLSRKGLRARAARGDRIALGPLHEAVALAARIEKRDRRVGDLVGSGIRGVVRAAAEYVRDIVGLDLPVGGVAALADAARRDSDFQRRFCQARAGPADEGITGSGRVRKRERLAFDRVGRRLAAVGRLVGAVSVVQVVGDRVGHGLPLSRKGLRARAARGDRIALGPLHEAVALAARIEKRDRRVGDLVGSGIRGVVRAAAEYVRDIVGLDLPVGGVAALADAARRDSDFQRRFCQARAGPADEGITGSGRVRKRERLAFDRVGRRLAAVGRLV